VIAANMTLIESPDDYEFVKHQGDVTVMRHKPTGKLMYTARSGELGRDAKDWH
jgi:hypothetical protein